MIGMSTETFKGFKWTIFCEDSFSFIELFCKENITEISVGVNGSDYELTDT